MPVFIVSSSQSPIRDFSSTTAAPFPVPHFSFAAQVQVKFSTGNRVRMDGIAGTLTARRLLVHLLQPTRSLTRGEHARAGLHTGVTQMPVYYSVLFALNSLHLSKKRDWDVYGIKNTAVGSTQ